MPRNLTLFDLDGTLLPVDSDFEWGEFLGRSGVVDGAHYRSQNERYYRAYLAGTLDIMEFQRFSLRPLTLLPRAEVEQLLHRFMDEVMRPQLRPSALELVAQHQRAGDLCAVVTATNAFVTAPIAEALGLAHLVATVPAQEDGSFTGAVRGTPCYREGKIARVEEWLESLGRSWSSFARTTFYSDSHNDMALLTHVDEAIATNPDPALRAAATSHGWRILELFDDH